MTRPDGRLYQPVKVAAEFTSNDRDDEAGVIVFGTHDVARALELAQRHVDYYWGAGYVPVAPETVWWRQGYGANHARIFEEDKVRGRAGVWFADIAEAAA